MLALRLKPELEKRRTPRAEQTGRKSNRTAIGRHGRLLSCRASLQ